MEIRVGHERITTFSQPLWDRNQLCAQIDKLESDTGKFTVSCNSSLIGRYLTIQLMEYGSLSFYNVTTLPIPSKI